MSSDPMFSQAAGSPGAKLVLLGVLWGANFPLMKVAESGLSPAEIVLARLLSAAVVLAIALRATGTQWPRGLGVWMHLAVTGALANLTTFTLYAVGTERIGASLAGTVAGAGPLITALIAAAALGERLTGRRVLGIGLGLAGIVVVTEPLANTSTRTDLLGALAMLGGTISYSAAFVYTRRMVSPLGLAPLSLAAGQITAALAMALALCPVFLSGPIDMSVPVIGAVAILGPVGTGVAYILYYGLVRDLGATGASAVSYLTPVVASVIGVAVLGESMTVTLLAGVTLVLAAIALTQSGHEHSAGGTQALLARDATAKGA